MRGGVTARMLGITHKPISCCVCAAVYPETAFSKPANQNVRYSGHGEVSYLLWAINVPCWWRMSVSPSTVLPRWELILWATVIGGVLRWGVLVVGIDLGRFLQAQPPVKQYEFAGSCVSWGSGDRRTESISSIRFQGFLGGACEQVRRPPTTQHSSETLCLQMLSPSYFFLLPAIFFSFLVSSSISSSMQVVTTSIS